MRKACVLCNLTIRLVGRLLRSYALLERPARMSLDEQGHASRPLGVIDLLCVWVGGWLGVGRVWIVLCGIRIRIVRCCAAAILTTATQSL